MSSEANQLQSSAELLKLSNLKVVTYSLCFNLGIIASCGSLDRKGIASHSGGFNTTLCADAQHKENSFFPLLIFPCSSSEAAAGDGRVAPNIAWLSSRLSSHHFGFAMVGASRGDCRFSFTHSTRWWMTHMQPELTHVQWSSSLRRRDWPPSKHQRGVLDIWYWLYICNFFGISIN